MEFGLLWMDVCVGTWQLLSLAFDGMTGGAQDKIRDDHHPHAHVMMVWMNVWSVLYLVICKSTHWLFTLHCGLLTLPYLTSGVDRLLHLPSAEAVSARPNARPQM